MSIAKRSGLSRRTFLSIAGAALAGPAGAASFQRVRRAKTEIRLGLIGCGMRGSSLLRELQRLAKAGANVRLLAVSDAYAPRARRAAAACGADVLTHWTALVERNDLDGIIIATPSHWHASMTRAAIDAGKDAYCETPMALSAAEAREVLTVLRDSDRVVQFGANATSEPQWSVARDLIDGGAIGPVQWCQAYAHVGDAPEQPGPAASIARAELDWDAFRGPAERPFDPERFRYWRHYWDFSGGVATESFYGTLAALLVATGERYPTRVAAAGGIYACDGRETPDSFVMMAEYAGGARFVMASCPPGRGGAPSAVIRGAEGTLELLGGRVRVTPEGAPAYDVACDARASHLDNWLSCMRTRETPVCGPELAFRAMAAAGLAVEAYRGRKTVIPDAVRLA